MKNVSIAKRAGPVLFCTLAVFAAERGGFTFERMLQRYDANTDGAISQSEFTGRPHLFERVDANHDGVLTQSEFDAAMKSRGKAADQKSRRERGGERYAKQGLQAGKVIPELTVYELSGNAVNLSDLWKDGPAILVTASVTCPISTGSCPSLNPLEEIYSDRVKIAVLYVKEAHPQESGDSSADRATGARSHPNPKNFQEKLELAQLFNQAVEPGNSILVDDLEGTAFKALGAGPNIGLLIDSDGRIVLRQGWYDAEAMRKAADQLLSGTSSEPSLHEIEYANVEGESLRLDLYLPEQTKTPPPLVVWIHGGGWKNGDKSNVNRAILRLREEGYAVASINYRLEDLSIHPKQIHDCKGAVRWLRAHADEYGYDAKRIAVGGGSAGGHLALLLGLSGGVAELEGTVGGNPNHAAPVFAIIDLYGPSELSVLAESSQRFNQAHTFSSEQLIHASPLTYLSPNDPPALILHGDLDRTVPIEQSTLLHKRYEDAGLPAELHILEGAGHGGAVFNDTASFELIKTFLNRHLPDR